MRHVTTDTLGGKIFEPESVNQLIKVLGMLGSEHDGERASAAAIADRIVRKLGLTWTDIISRPEPQSLSDLCAWLLTSDLLTIWEAGFVSTLRAPISVKQRDKLDDITRRIRAKGVRS